MHETRVFDAERHCKWFYQGIICILVRIAGRSEEGSRFHREAIRVVRVERSSKARPSLPAGELYSIDIVV